jgi:hypothetical protein
MYAIFIKLWLLKSYPIGLCIASGKGRLVVVVCWFSSDQNYL